MGFDRKDVVLAELQMPSTDTVNAQLNELLQPGGERVEPSAEYEARDASGTIRVTVDARRQLSDVDIQRGWTSRIPPDRLASVLFDTYVKAIQRSMVVELANSGAPDPLPSEAPVDDLAAKPHDEWVAAIRARISDLDARFEEIQRLEASKAAVAENEFRSPRGLFVLHVRNGSPTGLTASAEALAKAGSDRLRLDLLEIFTAAGLAAPTTVRPGSPSTRGAQRQEDDDSYEFRFDV